jgi:hypothetical protein
VSVRGLPMQRVRADFQVLLPFRCSVLANLPFNFARREQPRGKMAAACACYGTVAYFTPADTHILSIVASASSSA